MLSALIPSAGRKPAVLLAEQLAHESCVRPGPLVLGTAPLKSPTPTSDRDRHCCYRLPVVATGRGPGHFSFCLALHVAMQVGPSLHHSWRGVRHMASEDSGCLRCTLRYRPPPFMATATSRRVSNPCVVRCSPASIARTMR